MFDKYTEAARQAVFVARYEASQLHSPQIETEHLLLGILRKDAELARRLSLSAARIDAIRDRIAQRAPAASQEPSTSVDLPLSKESKRVLARAANESIQLKHNFIGTEHLLLGLSLEEGCFAAGILREHGLTTAQIRQEVVRAGEGGGASIRSAEAPPLAEGTRNLTAAANLGVLSPFIGRERELERIIHILSRRTRNNPVLIGESGVGRTAIVEGLAFRMASGAAPQGLAERVMLAVDASSLIAPRLRARTEGTAEGMLAEIAGQSNVILCVEGLFDLAATGSGWGVTEAIHLLEPYLAHGKIQCIATATPAGLRHTIERAGALARHFEVVDVPPPAEEEAIRMVLALKEQFEKFHEVVFGEGVIEAAVYASGRFLPGRHLPDRALDLIDEAGARVRLRRENEPPEVLEIRKRIRLHARGVEDAIAGHDFAKAREHSDRERAERESLRRLREERQPEQAPESIVHAQDVAEAVAERAGVPVAGVMALLERKQPAAPGGIAEELAAQVPAGAREWVPFLAAYLARCSEADAEKLAQAIRSAKAKASTP